MNQPEVNQLKAELHQLNQLKVHKIKQELQPLQESGEAGRSGVYVAVMEEIDRLTARMHQVKESLKHAQTSQPPVDDSLAVVGSRVRVWDEALAEEVTYQLVPSALADPINLRLSVTSPIGRALVGKRSGELCLCDTPGGPVTLRILSVASSPQVSEE